MDKLHERKINDSYKSPNGKCLEKFEFEKSLNQLNVEIREKSIENQ